MNTREPKLLFFDVGETLVSETRMWSAWADWLGVPRRTFSGALEDIIAQRRHHEEIFRQFRPDFDLAKERAARANAGQPDGFILDDVYPDARPTLQWARAAGYKLGVAGNNSRRTEDFVRSLGLPFDIVGSSERWGVAKPDAGFFQRIIDESGLAPRDIVYVGDRLDNDVLPALRLGMGAIFIARGPWGTIHATWPEARDVPVTIRSLAELPQALAKKTS